MRTRIQKWGNSLGLRIPKSVADEMGVGEGSEVDLSVQSKRLIVRRARKPKLRLDDLMRDVSAHNLHEGIDTGSPVGKEIW
jgi:antitoxin MazE